MDCHHRNAELGGLDCGTRHRIRNVMEFEIEKDFPTPGDDFMHNLRTTCREELAPHFEHTDDIMKLLHETQGLLARTDVQRNDDSVLHLLMASPFLTQRAIALALRIGFAFPPLMSF